MQRSPSTALAYNGIPADLQASLITPLTTSLTVALAKDAPHLDNFSFTA
jgi:hypothetical protein